VAAPRLIHHAASLTSGPPPNTLWALGECLRRGVDAVEIDITPLADSDWLLAHDRDLESFSTGRGPVAAATTADSRAFFLVRNGAVGAEHPGLLSDALDLVERLTGPTLVQLDLKAPASLPPAALPGLVSLVAPVRDRVLVSSPADWCLAELRRLAPWIRLGFDPHYYLDTIQGRRSDGTLSPPRASQFGLFDDPADDGAPSDEPESELAYLGARFAALWTRASDAEIWFVRGLLLARTAKTLDPVAHLHSRGARVAAWTIDPIGPPEVELARSLAHLGVDFITTNLVDELRAHL
jgi:glycerophosphoryl diester phosphodiesterase